MNIEVSELILFLLLIIVPIALVLLARGKDKNAYWYGFIIALYQTILKNWGTSFDSLNYSSIAVIFVGLLLAASFSFMIANKVNPRFGIVYLILWSVIYYVLYGLIFYIIGIVF